MEGKNQGFILLSWFGGFVVAAVLRVLLFFEKELRAGWVGRGRILEDSREGKNMIKIHINVKVVSNKVYKHKYGVCDGD